MASKTLQCHSGELLFLLGPATKWELSLKFISVCFSFSFSFSFENTDSFACCVPIMWAATPPPPPPPPLPRTYTCTFLQMNTPTFWKQLTCLHVPVSVLQVTAKASQQHSLHPPSGMSKHTNVSLTSLVRSDMSTTCSVQKAMCTAAQQMAHIEKWTHRTFAIMSHVT